jgi:hypothetical protein
MSQQKDRLAYARANLDLDAGRRVLQCHGEGCTIREKWSDAARAVTLGWSHEDRVVSGRRIRFWYCQTCKKPEALLPLTMPHPVQDLRDRSAELFGGRRVVIVRFGASMTQVAVVLQEYSEFVDVVAWSAGPMHFRQPKTVSKDRIIGTAGPNDRRVRNARAEWPSFYARELAPKNKRKRKSKKATKPAQTVESMLPDDMRNPYDPFAADAPEPDLTRFRGVGSGSSPMQTLPDGAFPIDAKDAPTYPNRLRGELEKKF